MLDPRIPPADRAAYADVRDAKDWKNPYLMVESEGVTLIVGGRRERLPVAELPKRLCALPTQAWPYGRVVAMQEAGIRTAGDDAKIADNVRRVTALLAAMGVTVERWPSA